MMGGVFFWTEKNSGYMIACHHSSYHFSGKKVLRDNVNNPLHYWKSKNKFGAERMNAKYISTRKFNFCRK